ncbi:MAG: MotA/TolQ/ExbB proton channel family protein [Prosthecobacter sp.]|nr:MotA/TolQ/ExbB proton channel family protein [Prosthecobacter sp.]
MDFIQHTLQLISNALLLPTLAAILLLLIWTILMVGGLMREWLGRKATRRCLTEALELARNPTSGTASLEKLRTCPGGLPARFAQSLGTHLDDLQERSKTLEDMETDVAARLSQLTWSTRVAPMLGLMGTLIPLGPALTGLASGNVAELSSNLVVAFTATVIGVLIGCTTYTLSSIRRSWYGRDMSDLEYILTRLENHA